LTNRDRMRHGCGVARHGACRVLPLSP
jgi:hypothetical protein